MRNGSRNPNASGRGRPQSRRKGTLVVLAAVLMIVMVGMLAFSIDVGYMYTMQTQLDRATDSAALAAAGSLVDGPNAARQRAIEYLVRNPVGGGGTVVEESELSTMMSEFEQEYDQELQVELGHWNPETGQIDSAGGGSPSTISVKMQYPNMPLFFGRLLGKDHFSIQSESIARFQPRDIMVVLDLSASMNNDSEFQSISSLGRTAVENNLYQIYQELGSPIYGNMQWEPVYISSTSRTTIKNILGLNNVPYPYPSGSWNSYIDWAKSNSWSNNNRRAGYRKKYGYKNLVNYWLEKKPKYSQTPDLWQVSAQPITAVKDAVDLFTDFVSEVDTNDRIGLSVYNAYDGNGKLEVSLTETFDDVSTASRQRQAGHYHTYTNIGAGMQTAREELENNGRPGAFKMMVVMTDGRANWVNGGYSTWGAENYVNTEANRAKSAHIPVVTISLGAGADTSLMESVADTTDGIHFRVPGGRPVSEYSTDLINVFRIIADSRPLNLVK